MHYYYTIAALPDLPDYKTILEPAEFRRAVDLIERNLEPEDQFIFNYVKYPIDHNNLISAIIKECHDIDLPHNEMAVWPEEMVRNFRRNKDGFPDYIRSFLIEHEERLNEYSIRTLEEALYVAFLNELELTSSAFLKAYFNYDFELRSVAALINSQVFKTDPHSEIISTQLTSALTGVPHPSVLKEYPYLEKLITAMNTKHPDEIIDQMDRIRWHFIDSQISVLPFSIDHVLGYYLKLLIIKRRSELHLAGTHNTIHDIIAGALENSNMV